MGHPTQARKDCSIPVRARPSAAHTEAAAAKSLNMAATCGVFPRSLAIVRAIRPGGPQNRNHPPDGPFPGQSPIGRRNKEATMGNQQQGGGQVDKNKQQGDQPKHQSDQDRNKQQDQRGGQSGQQGQTPSREPGRSDQQGDRQR
jgi:hypothetical protein